MMCGVQTRWSDSSSPCSGRCVPRRLRVGLCLPPSGAADRMSKSFKRAPGRWHTGTLLPHCCDDDDLWRWLETRCAFQETGPGGSWAWTHCHRPQWLQDRFPILCFPKFYSLRVGRWECVHMCVWHRQRGKTVNTRLLGDKWHRNRMNIVKAM